jgi:outer membrane biogenesis lipoprotein LolB
MMRSRCAVLATAALLLLAACGKDAQEDAAPAAAPPAAEAAPPSGIGGTPAYARRGVDSANAAIQQRQNAVDSLGAAGGGVQAP